MEGLKIYADFDVIEIVDGIKSYPTLFGIGCVNENLVMNNFKKRVMTFENCDIRIIAHWILRKDKVISNQ